MKRTNKLLEFVARGFVPLICTILCVGCLTPIENPGEFIGGQIVISGQISTIPEQNIIQIGRTAATERLPFPMSGATVTVYDDLGNSYNYLEDPYKAGTYLLEYAFATVGVSYHAVIITPEGKVYESKPEVLPPSAGNLTTNYEIVSETYTDGEGTVTTSPFLKIYADVTLPESSESLYLKWNVDEAFVLTPTDFPDPFAQVPPSCYVEQSADPQSITLLNGEEMSSLRFDHMLVASRLVDWTFLERHYLTTYQVSLTKEAFEYWKKVDILANSVGSIFDTPPAEIKGNFSSVNDPTEKVHGYFQAVNEVYDRFYLLPADFPFPLLFDGCTFESFSSQYPPRCLDCLSVRNSSHKRPTWF